MSQPSPVASPRVAFLIPYIGTWPKWSELFFQSCEPNTCVAVLLVCEQPPPCRLPGNVQVIEMDRTELVRRLALATGLNLTALGGHKLCDFRPFFGLAFEDLLRNFEFWGFCDLDIMFGDLKKLLTPDFLESMDVFSAHDLQFAGHFTILRNVSTVNRVCFQMQGWRERCLAPSTKLVEEYLLAKTIEDDPSIRLRRPGSLNSELQRDFGRFGITFDFLGQVAYLSEPDAPVVHWENGSVFYTSRSGRRTEVLYLHFMGLKRWWHWCLLTDQALRGPRHTFSRLGYGGPHNPLALQRFPWRQFFWLQYAVGNFKGIAGRFLRRHLPMETFLRLRRLIFERSR